MKTTNQFGQDFQAGGGRSQQGDAAGDGAEEDGGAGSQGEDFVLRKRIVLDADDLSPVHKQRTKGAG